jgi:hypothetical protein
MNYQVMYCNPITAIRTTKALQRIVIAVQKDYLAAKKSAGGSMGPPLSVPYRPSDEEVDEIAQSSLGDMRHAVVQLQLLCVYRGYKVPGAVRPATRIGSGSSSLAPVSSGAARHRDVSFSSLRGVGKLLSAQQNDQGRLNKDVDTVMERSEFPLDMSLAFMQFHCVESLHRSSSVPADVGAGDAEVALLEDIALALDCYAEAGIFWDKQYSVNSNLMEHGGSTSGGSDNISAYPVCYAVAIASRAAGVARGATQRSWSKSAISQAWDYIAPVAKSDSIIDLSVDDDVDDAHDEWKSSDSKSRTSSKQIAPDNKRKKIRAAAGSAGDDPPPRTSGKTGGFVKLTRPKVLDLWRSNKWSEEQVKHLRYELVCVNREESVLPTQNPLRSWLTNRELYVTLIPLLRSILEYSNLAAFDPNYSDFSPLVRKRLRGVFSLNSIFDTDKDSTAEVECISSMPPTSTDVSIKDDNKDDEENILLMDDIEDF